MANIFTTTVESNDVAAGTRGYGFGGEVPVTELWNGEELANLLGITQGTAQHINEPWLKFYLDGKVILKSKKPYRYSISWNHLNQKNAVYGDKIITDKNGNEYKIRLMRGALTDPSKDGDPDKGAKYSEWNKLMLPIHQQAKNKNWSYPQNVEPEIPRDWDINYTDADLLTKNSAGYGSYQLCQETAARNSNNSMYRGYVNVSYLGITVRSANSTYYGWSPVLELITKPPHHLIEINEPLSEDVFIQEGMKDIADWQELHEHDNQLVCLTDFFGDDVEVLVYEEEPDENNKLELGITANYSPIDELKGEGELLIQTSREDILVEGMTTAPVYALSKKLKREDFLQMTDPFIEGNGSIELSISEDLINWQPGMQLKDLSVASVMSWPDTFYVRLTYKDCPRCFIGFMQLWDWELISDSPIEQNSITSIIQHFYSGIAEIPNHTLQISLNDGGSWTTIKEGIINEIAASVTQTGQMRLRVTGNKDQVIYPYSYSWTEIGGI